MPRCAFFTGKFTQCTSNTPHADHTYCRTHANKAQRMIDRVGALPAGGCPCVVGNPGHWCGRAVQEGQPICGTHIRRRDDQVAHAAEREARRAAVNLLTDEYMLQVPRPDWRDVVDDVQVRANLPHEAEGRLGRMLAGAAARRFFLLTTEPTVPVQVFLNYWVGEPEDFFVDGAVLEGGALPEAAPPVAPVGVLAGLAADTQSVHREVVVKQTNTNVELLLEASEEAAEDFDPESWVTTWWLLMPNRPAFNVYYRVMQDIHFWYTKKTCKATSDWLYKRVFTGAVFKISAVDDRDRRYELAKRLWEECSEAVDMCCEGHIGRLANVFVGFDENFKSPASPNEMLQTQLAAIAQLKLRPELKLAKAKTVMDELGIPEAERAPWLEALEE
jgi:hypothetical protein